MEEIKSFSFFCYYGDSEHVCKKFQKLKWSELGKWIDAYMFTHPNCIAVSCKVWREEIEC